MKIKYKIIGMFLMSAILPFIVVATFVFLDFKSALEKEVINSLDLVATIQKNRVEELMQSRSAELYTFTHLSPLTSEIKNYSETYSFESLSKINFILQSAKNGVERYSDIHVVGLNGIVIASTQDNVGKNISNEDPFKLGFDKPNFYTLKKDANGNIINEISAPIYEGSQKLAILIIDVNAADLFDLFNDRTGLKETGDWGLSKKFSEAEGVVIVPSKYEVRPEAPLNVRFDLNKNLPASNAVIGLEQISTDTVDFRGKSVITVTKFLKDPEWGLVVKIDKDEVYQPIYELAQYLVFFMSLISFFTFAIGVFLASMLSKPLDRLLKAVYSIQAGDLNVRSNIKTDDEIGLLSKSFDNMTAKLKSALDNLENKVVEKTKELSDKISDLERLNKVTVNRELKMIELKEKIKKLSKNHE